MTRLGNPIAQAIAVPGAPASVIVDRPQAGELQSTDGLLHPMESADFFVMDPSLDIDDYIGTDSVEIARWERTVERKKMPLPSTRGPIDYPFGNRTISNCIWRAGLRSSTDEPPTTTEIYCEMQQRLTNARDHLDPAGEMLPRTIPGRAIGEGGISIIYPGKEGSVLKFANSNFAAEKLHVVHAGLHVFGISHLEIRTDNLALDVAQTYGIIEQRMLPEGSTQLKEITGSYVTMDGSAFSAVEDGLGKEARDELEALVAEVAEFNGDALMHNEAFFRGYSVWDLVTPTRDNRYATFVCDAFRSHHWDENVFFNPDPSMRWFLLDW